MARFFFGDQTITCEVRRCGYDGAVQYWLHGVYRWPTLGMVESLDAETAWWDIGMGESATAVHYRPGGWRAQCYIVVRRLHAAWQLE